LAHFTNAEWRDLNAVGKFGSMLNIDYLRAGSSVELPELSGYVPHGRTAFTVEGVFHGGMGVCVHLRHTPSGAEYALKGVRPDYIDEQATIDRFLDELRVWLSASSCNLVAEALAVVRINEMPCALATWMPNGDLAHALPRLTKTDKMEALLRIVRGLSWVKSNLGVIHRDLKPSNVLLDAQDLAYVADWGLARPIGRVLKNIGAKAAADTFDRPDRTQAGSFLGTVTYAAPEQIMGSDMVDHRADIYALGCMMYEFETGAPPFLGQTVSEIAVRHLQEKPKKLGGWFSSTELGLEHVIARCLEKGPDARYPRYEALEADLLSVARRHVVRLDRCTFGTRYKRTILGKGIDQQTAHFDSAAAKGSGDYALVEFDDVAPFLEEANNLVALDRFAEAEKLLRPQVLPEMLDSRAWGPQHAVAVSYGLCLVKMGRALDADALFGALAHAEPKPAEFYVNYSLALLGLSKWKQATNVCRMGLRVYPSDLGIQGNLTIALSNSGEHEQAFESALRRLNLRRDVHALDEAASVLLRHARAIRNEDLPRAIDIAKTMGQLVKEGGRLNPRYYTMRLKEIYLRRFAYDGQAVTSLVQGMLDADDCAPALRRLALTELVEDLSEGKDFESALALIQKSQLADEPRLKEIMLRTIARRKMIGMETREGKRVVVPQVVDFFLHESSSGGYPDRVLAAELQDWLGRQDAAITTLEAHLSTSPSDWDGIKLMAMIHIRQGHSAKAVEFAQALVKQAPWRAESYDCLAYVADKTGRADLVEFAKTKGDHVFAEETRLYDDLRTFLDR
jgi:serine/threonine protein kinase